MPADQIFEALASRPRREILAYLSAQELTAGEIGQRFAMSAPAISRHLSVLAAAGLVISERRGQFVFYRLTRCSANPAATPSARPSPLPDRTEAPHGTQLPQ